MSARPDVIVIGAGLVGAMTTLRLAEAGLHVTLLETDFAGGGSSGAAMGHLVVMDDSAPQLALCAYSRRRWQELATTLPASAEYQQCGTLWIGATDDELSSATVRMDSYRAHGVAVERLGPGEMYALEPHLRPGLAGALLVPGDAVCYPPLIARVLCERACALGARVQAGAHVVRVADRRVDLLDGTSWTAGNVVIATGATAPALIPGLPILPRKGHLVITDRQPQLIRHQLVELGYLASAHTFAGASVAFNLQPRQTGQVLIGSSRELVGYDAHVNHTLVGAMLARATAFVPALAQARALRTWTGFRPATPDKLPLIGRWRDTAGLWIAAGHEGLGITMATGTADLIVAGIVQREPPVDAQPFRPDRPMPAIAHAA